MTSLLPTNVSQLNKLWTTSCFGVNNGLSSSIKRTLGYVHESITKNNAPNVTTRTPVAYRKLLYKVFETFLCTDAEVTILCHVASRHTLYAAEGSEIFSPLILTYVNGLISCEMWASEKWVMLGNQMYTALNSSILSRRWPLYQFLEPWDHLQVTDLKQKIWSVGRSSATSLLQ